MHSRTFEVYPNHAGNEELHLEISGVLNAKLMASRLVPESMRRPIELHWIHMKLANNTYASLHVLEIRFTAEDEVWFMGAGCVAGIHPVFNPQALLKLTFKLSPNHTTLEVMWSDQEDEHLRILPSAAAFIQVLED